MQEGWNMFVTDHFVFISVPVDLSMHGLWCSALYALLSFLAANGILLGFRTDSSMYLSAFLPLKDPNLPKPAKRRRKELVQRSFQVLQHYLSFRNCMQNWRRPCDMRELLDLFWPFWAWQFSHLLAKMLNLEQRLLFCGFVGRNEDQRSPPYKKSVAGVDLVFQCRDVVTFSCQWWILNKACFPPNSK